MKHAAHRFFLPAVAMILAADVGTPAGAAGGSADAAPAVKTSWKDSPELKDASTGKPLSIDRQLSASFAHIEKLEGQLASLTRERDDAIALAKNPSEQAVRIMAENPSAAARAILAACGGPAVAMRPAGSRHPGEAAKATPGNVAGRTPLDAAIAKAQAGGFKKR